MFKQRLTTALILVPLVLLGLYYSNLTCFSAASLFLLLICAIEWQQLIPLNNSPKHRSSKNKPFQQISLVAHQSIFFISLFIAMLLAHFLLSYWLGVGLLLWLLILLAIFFFPQSQLMWGYPFVVSLFSLVLLPLFAESLMTIYQMNEGKALIVYLLLLVWAADIGAYLAGKLWGKYKLIPKVSPGKTIEGVAGGGFLSLSIAIAAYFYFQPSYPIQWNYPLAIWFAMATFVFIMALIGDLLISMLKRRVHLKDTGHLFPGHGGILDRLDSLIAAAPAFYFALKISQGT
jgi:phosphatidate cytidylyltransferase